jgi:hypothetical protein
VLFVVAGFVAVASAQSNSTSADLMLPFICEAAFFCVGNVALRGHPLTVLAYSVGPAVCAVATSTRCGTSQPICCPSGTTCCLDAGGVARSCTAAGGSCCAAGQSCAADRACCGGGCMFLGETCCGTYRCSVGQACWPETGTCVAGMAVGSPGSRPVASAVLTLAAMICAVLIA